MGKRSDFLYVRVRESGVRSQNKEVAFGCVTIWISQERSDNNAILNSGS